MIFRLNLPQKFPEKFTSIGILFGKVLVILLGVFHQLLKSVESFDPSLVDQIYEIDVRRINGL